MFKVVSGSRDATLRMWDIETGECNIVLVGKHSTLTHHLAFYSGKAQFSRRRKMFNVHGIIDNDDAIIIFIIIVIMIMLHKLKKI